MAFPYERREPDQPAAEAQHAAPMPPCDAAPPDRLLSTSPASAAARPSPISIRVPPGKCTTNTPRYDTGGGCACLALFSTTASTHCTPDGTSTAFAACFRRCWSHPYTVWYLIPSRKPPHGHSALVKLLHRPSSGHQLKVGKNLDTTPLPVAAYVDGWVLSQPVSLN